MSEVKDLKITLKAPELNKVDGKIMVKPQKLKFPVDKEVIE
jgi:hypothetical protein